jgi:hypothetical protein
MSKLMSVLGIILLAVGLVLGLLELMQPGRVQGLGISIGTAVDLIIGGILALGLGGVIDALRGRSDFAMDAAAADSEPAPAPAPTADDLLKTPADADAAEPAPAAEEAPGKMRFGFGRKTAAAAAATTVAVTEVAEAAKTPVQETLDALEQAKQDIKGALGGVESITAPAPAAEVVEEAAAPAEDELYVVEEKSIRGRPARILSDDTVEAETDEGWMRFENLEHLNEYLDAAGN